MKVRIKKTHPDAKIPSYSKPGDAGMDLHCVSVKHTDIYIEYDTGLSFEIPEGFVGLLFPRSSLTNYDLILGNHVGVIDSGYRGTTTFRFKISSSNYKNTTSIYNVGDKIGQMIIIPYPKIEFEVADELTSTERGAGGYGSTGK